MKRASSVAAKADVSAVKSDVEKLALSTAKEFSNVHKRIDALDEKIEDRFEAVQEEMQEGFKAVLAAIESVEYVKLRMRIDTLESDVTKIKEKVHLS